MKSLVLLRRMIINQKPARVDYRIGATKKSIYYDRAGFEGNGETVVTKLREIFEAESVQIASGPDLPPSLTEDRVFAPKAISAALANYQFSAEVRALLLSFAMRMPPLIVRLYPMQRYAFQDYGSYVQMHKSYQRNGSLKMQNFLSQAEGGHEEAVRLRVMMATYLLGLIAPLKSDTSTAQASSTDDSRRPDRAQPAANRSMVSRSSRVSVLSRIINRIRGL